MKTTYLVKAVILDMDGVIADTKDALLASWGEALKQRNIPIRDNELQSLVVGVVHYNKIRVALAEAGFQGDASNFIREAEQLYHSKISSYVYPVKGVTDFLRKLQQLRLPMALATSASGLTTNIVLQSLGVSGFFSFICTSDDVEKRKPDPEVFEVAIRRLGFRPDNCIIIEDSPEGILAAKKQRAFCIGLASTFDKKVLRNADIVISSFDEFPWKLFKFSV